MAKTYNPYNDYRKIVGYKGDWHNAQSFGQDPSQFYQAAMPYYQSLIDNGYEDLANELSNSNYTQAKGLRDKYGLKEDAQYNLDQTYNDMTGFTPDNMVHRNDASIDRLLDMASGASGMANEAYNAAMGIANGTTPITPNAATQNLLDAYAAADDRLNGAIRYDDNGNVISGLNTEHYNIGRNQLDYYNNFDVTKQPYYEGIMAQYKLGGQNAADNAYANGAANNSGNIDSYAAANANRQQLAYTTAGQQAALAAAQQNANNWNALYSQMSSDLYNQGALSLSTLDAAKQMYAVDAQERMNALDNAGALASAQMQSSIAAFEQLVQERMNDKNITAEMAMQEKDIAAAKEQLEAQLASNERIQEGINNVAYYQTDANERMNAENAYTQRYGYDTQLAGTRYNADANRDIAGINASASRDVAGINANASLGVAGINADASKYNAGLNYDLNRYLGDLGYSQSLAQNDLNRYLGELSYNQALAGYENALQQIREKGAVDVETQKQLVAMGLVDPTASNQQVNEAIKKQNELYAKNDLSKVIESAIADYESGQSSLDVAERAVKMYGLQAYSGEYDSYIEKQFDRYKKLAAKSDNALENLIAGMIGNSISSSDS